MKFGAHVSAAGGVFKAVINAQDMGAECFQFFSRSPQGGPAPVLTADIVKQFKDLSKKYKLEGYIHTSYFINFASEQKRIYHGSISIVRQELERASLLGVPYVMTHLGSSKDVERKIALAQTLRGLEEVLQGYKGTAMLLLENSAGAGQVIGADFAELGDLVKNLNKKYKVGVCLDTCHAFASGYDLRDKKSVDATLKQFDKHVGLKYLKLLHLNDSLTPINSHKDRHANIGQGQIGRDGIAEIINHPKLQKINAILETPDDKQRQKDLQLLKKLHRS